MANGSIVDSIATWHGEIGTEGIRTEASFEVFDSHGSWDFLLGKRLLTALKAVHKYETDEVTVEGTGGRTTLKNQADLVGNREQRNSGTQIAPTCIITDEQQLPKGEESATEIDVEASQGDNNLFTRTTEPYKLERVKEILRLVTVGTDLSEEQRTKVRSLINSFADIFALSMHEVGHVEEAIHHLEIDPDAVFSKKVHQKPLTPPQRRYLYTSIDTMLSAGIIEPCTPEEVKCVSPTTLAQKAHQGKGLSLPELQHRINDECVTYYIWLGHAKSPDMQIVFYSRLPSILCLKKIQVHR